jgi:hypothetical protein
MNNDFKGLPIVGFPPKAPLCCPLPEITTAPVLGRKAKLVPEFFDTDMLVLTQTEGTRAGGYVKLLDEHLGGAIAKAKEQAGFRGVRGSSLLLDLDKEGLNPARPRYIFLVGLGKYKDFALPVVCGMTRMVLEKAAELLVERVSIPIGSNRLTQESLNLIGTGSIIHCRLEERYAQHGGIGDLKELKILCTPQARKHLEEGLRCSTPRCPICPDLRIDRK